MKVERPSSPNAFLLVIAYLGFISLGLPDTLIGVAWPSARQHFGVQQDAVALIFFGAGISYFFSSFFAGRLLQKIGIGFLLAGSSAFVALSGFGYGLAPIWMAFAACSLIHGLGSGAIDAGLNHYVAHHFSARHMSWLHACYTLGATLGPVIMTAAIARNGAWRAGYLTVAFLLLTLAILFFLTRKSWNDQGSETIEQTAENATLGDTLRHPATRLQIAIFFAYTGLEATAGQWSFTLLTESRQISPEIAGIWVTVYWASILAGRILFGFVMDRFGIDRLLRWCMVTSFAGAGLFLWNPAPASSVVALAVIGIGLAPVFPCLMTRTPQRLGSKMAAHAIGYQVSAGISGAAALPSLTGFLAQRFGLEVIAGAVIVLAAVVLALHERLLRISGAECQ